MSVCRRFGFEGAWQAHSYISRGFGRHRAAVAPAAKKVCLERSRRAVSLLCGTAAHKLMQIKGLCAGRVIGKSLGLFFGKLWVNRNILLSCLGFSHSSHRICYESEHPYCLRWCTGAPRVPGLLFLVERRKRETARFLDRARRQPSKHPSESRADDKGFSGPRKDHGVNLKLESAGSVFDCTLHRKIWISSLRHDAKARDRKLVAGGEAARSDRSLSICQCDSRDPYLEQFGRLDHGT